MDSLSDMDRIASSPYLLRDLVQERLGLSLSDGEGVRSMINQLADRIQKTHCQSVLKYYHLLMNGDAVGEQEWRHLAATLAKSKTGFWRHTNAVRTLAHVTLPQLLLAFPSEPLRIWSSSCSTGEEPALIAIALNEAGWFERATIEIRASDASYEVIERARQGVFDAQRIRALDVNLRDKYFIREEAGWRLAPDLHKRIQWTTANLMMPDEVADLARSHVILCRNVFIYFTGHAICKTLRLFARFMPAGAHLLSDNGEYFTGLVSSTNLFAPAPAGAPDVWIRRDIAP